MVYREALQLFATCGALWVFCTPLAAARTVARERSVGARTPLPYAAIALNCSIWVVYGLIIRDWFPLVASNSVGALSGTYCLSVFTRYAKPPLQVHARRLQTGVVGAFVCLAIVCRGTIARGVDKDAAEPGVVAALDASLLTFVGRVGVLACVAMFASPLSTISRVLETRSTASMPLAMTLSSATCSSAWMLYGRDIGDVYVWGPNAAGLVFSAMQLALYFHFGKPGSGSSASYVDLELSRGALAS